MIFARRFGWSIGFAVVGVMLALSGCSSDDGVSGNDADAGGDALLDGDVGQRDGKAGGSAGQAGSAGKGGSAGGGGSETGGSAGEGGSAGGGGSETGGSAGEGGSAGGGGSETGGSAGEGGSAGGGGSETGGSAGEGGSAGGGGSETGGSAGEGGSAGGGGSETGGSAGEGGSAGGGGSETGGSAGEGGSAGGGGSETGGSAGEGGSAGGGGSETGGSAGEGGSAGGGGSETGGSAGEGGSGGSGGTGGLGGSGGGIPVPSCEGMVGTECQGTSCCSSILVPGGNFPMGRSTDGTDKCPGGLSCFENEVPEHQVMVSDYYLDEFQVTVGRFRKFVEQYKGTPPAEGWGAHPKIPGSGWKKDWNQYYHATQADLVAAIKCSENYKTWRDTPSGTEQHPINCVTWYEAFAFCAWDGGRLPTEAEWEKAAAGGDENRLFPWGSEWPDNTRASYECRYHSEDSGCSFADIVKVGMLPAGAGRWGHKDLAGNMWEWTLDLFYNDWYNIDQGNACVDCANLIAGTGYRVLRGGAFGAATVFLRAVGRNNGNPSSRAINVGIRCARAR